MSHTCKLTLGGTSRVMGSFDVTCINYYNLHCFLGNKYAGYSQIYLIFPAFHNPSSE
jgi:hypothetical protein